MTEIQTHPPCAGCTHCAPDISGKFQPSCRRFPPQWTTPMLVHQPRAALAIVGGDGEVNPGPAMTGGGWAFPPAVVRCGEFSEG